jgi:hypothetical protein
VKGRYWVDANSFIWGARDPFPMPGMMAYWSWFEKQVAAKKITSHKRVIEEVLGGTKKTDTDPLISWVRSRKDKLADSASDSKECQELVGKLSEYSLTKFGMAKTIEFTWGADLWLIARAKLDDGAVVTQESDKKPVRIPAVCTKFGVPYKAISQMNKELNVNL